MKIMTLNVNGFKGNGEGEVKENKTKCDENINQIKNLINDIVINKNDIIILQEIPHMFFDLKERTWSYEPLYEEFKKMFSEYKVLVPKNLINSNQCTVAICKNDSSWEQHPEDILKYDKKNSYGNKFVELKCGYITLLGVHMPMDNNMWDLLIETLKGEPYTYVIGDFNANEKRGEMQYMPSKIRDCWYNPLIPNNKITYYPGQSSIDNIYVKSNFIMDNDTTIKVINTNLTDHALCILEYDCDVKS